MILVKIERYNESLFKTINLQTTESFFEDLNNDNKEILDIHEKTIKNRTFKFNLLQDKIIFDGGDADLMFYEKLDNWIILSVYLQNERINMVIEKLKRIIKQGITINVLYIYIYI